MDTRKPLCFVLMPFGKKPDPAGKVIDFDRVFEKVIHPAIISAGLEPLRADQEMVGGIIHKAMFERLILCDYAVADLTTANANVFYELGIRHAVRPFTTIAIFEEGSRLPFDVAPMRAIPYRLDRRGSPVAAEETSKSIGKRLVEARKAILDSPVFQLVDCMNPPYLDHEKTDIFRETVDYSARIKERIAEARRNGIEAIRDVQASLGPVEDIEMGVLIDLFLSYRAVKAWGEMIALVGQMPRPLSETVLVQEQLAFALNRSGRDEKAESVLLALISQYGASSETYGILGRVYKDRWEKAKNDGNETLARGILTKAIDAYIRGFEADWRDAYPGVNAVTLMEYLGSPNPEQALLIPVVSYSVERKIASGRGDYWDYATRLELAVLARDKEKGIKALEDALAHIREKWEPETTARNLRLIREVRQKRGEPISWELDLERELIIRTTK